MEDKVEHNFVKDDDIDHQSLHTHTGAVKAEEQNSVISDSPSEISLSEMNSMERSDSMPDLVWPDKNSSKTDIPASISRDTGFASDEVAETPSPGAKQLDITEELSKKEPENEEEEDGVMDVLGNGLLKKKIITNGQGLDTRPNNGDTVTIRVDGRLSDNTSVDAGDFTFILGDGDVILAFDLAVALMEEREKCELFTSAKYAYSTLGRGPDIPKNADITYTIELIKVQPAEELSMLGYERRLQMGEAKRGRGNYLYGRLDYSGAINSYNKAVKILDDPELNNGLDEASRALLTESWVKCYNNLAACQLKIDALDAAIRSCERVLSVQEDNVKALFRIGKARGAKGQLEEALSSLRKAVKLDPECKMVHQEMLNLSRRKSKETATERELYQKMLGVKPGENPFITEKKTKSSNLLMKCVLVAGGVTAVLASLGLTWYRTS